MHLFIRIDNIILCLVHCRIVDMTFVVEVSYIIALLHFIQNIENDCETFHTLAIGNAM